MTQQVLLCLILANTVMGLAMASRNAQTVIRPDPPAASPSSRQAPYKAEAPAPRKLGKHRAGLANPPDSAPGLSPPEEAQTQNKVHSGASGEPSNEAINMSVDGQETHLNRHHHSVDKSVAGGGVILGGLATTFLVSVFCYIKATGRHKADNETTA